VLTEDKQRTILALLREGNARRVALRCAGYTQNADEYWEKQGKLGNEPYASFVAAMHEAEAYAEADLVKIVRTAAIEDAKHAQWMLERKFKWWVPRDGIVPGPTVSVPELPSGVTAEDIRKAAESGGE
jgi:hypothetical protein